MEKMRARLPEFSELSGREKALLAICLALVIALIATICISINIRVNMQREYTSVRRSLGEQLYTNMSMLIQTFDMTTVPNADLKNAVIPQMKSYFVAATTVNEALSQSFGPRYRLLTDADISAVNTAFGAYESAFRSESPTDLAQADMLACMTRMSDLLTSRYSGGELRAAR